MGKVSISLTDKLPITKEDHFSRPRSFLGRQSLGDGGLILPFYFLLARSPRVFRFPSFPFSDIFRALLGKISAKPALLARLLAKTGRAR